MLVLETASARLALRLLRCRLGTGRRGAGRTSRPFSAWERVRADCDDPLRERHLARQGNADDLGGRRSQKLAGVYFFVLTWCVFSQIRCRGHALAVFQAIEFQRLFVSARQTVPVVGNAG